MNSSVLSGVGGVLLGTVVGFAGAGLFKGSDVKGGSAAQGSQSMKTDRSMRSTTDLAGGSGASRSAASVREVSEIYDTSSQTERVQKLLDYYANLNPSEYEAEAAKLEGLPFSDRMISAYLLFSQWAEVDPMQAMSFTASMGRAAFFVRPTVLQSWAASDPHAAAAYYKENQREFSMMGGRGPGGAASGTIAREWARQDPQGALAWAKSLEGREGTEAVAGVLRQMASNDPLAAISMAKTLTGEQRSEAYQDIASEWARTDWNAAESWITGLPADQRDQVMRDALRSLAGTDPQAASIKALTLQDTEARNGAILSVVEEWSNKNPVAALNYVMKNGSEEIQRESMRDVMGALTREDPAQAINTINEMETGVVRDSAVGTYIWNNQAGDPRESINLAATMSDESERSRMVGMSAFRWMQVDPAAASDFINSTDLIGDDAKDRILNNEGGGFWGGRGGRNGGR